MISARRPCAWSRRRAQLPDELFFWPPFLGSFYGVAAVVKAAAGARELVQGRDWVPADDVYQHSSFCVAKAIVAGRAGDRERAAALFNEGDTILATVPAVRALYRRYAGEAAIADGWGEPGRGSPRPRVTSSDGATRSWRAPADRCCVWPEPRRAGAAHRTTTTATPVSS